MLLLVGLGPTTACMNQGSRAAASDTPTTLAIGHAEPQSSPRSDVGFAALLSLLSDARLVNLAVDGQVTPGLAERWEMSPDGCTWRFFLRPNLRFHDGQPLTAEAVRQGLIATLDEGNTLYPGLRDIMSIEAQGATEVVLKLESPSWLLPEALALAGVRSASPAKSGAGPFRLERQSATEATLRAFDGYYRGRPAIDRVTVKVYPRPRAAWAALLRGEVNFLYDVTPEAVEFLEQARELQVHSFLRPYVHVLGFNLRHPVLRHREVRLALNYAADRQAIIEQTLAKSGVPANGHIAPGHWAADERITPFPYDPERATALLTQAGVSGVTFTCLVAAGYPRAEHLALVLQRQLIEVGVNMDIEVLPLSELLPRLATGRFDAYLLEMAGGDLNYPYWWWHSGTTDEAPLLDSGYTAADAALDKLRYARDRDTARAGVQEFQRTLREDPPAVFLCWGETARALSTKFTLPEDADGDITTTIAAWSVKDEASGLETGLLSTAGSP